MGDWFEGWWGLPVLLGLVALLLVVAVIAPIALLWALNVLWKPIPYQVDTYCACGTLLILLGVLRGSTIKK